MPFGPEREYSVRTLVKAGRVWLTDNGRSF